jgi:thioredoxin 1
MATVALTGKNFEEHVEKPGILIIDWWAPWCGPCRTFGPIYDKASDRHPDAVFGKINTEDQPELAGQFGIQSIPTLMVFRDQILVFARPGMIPGEALDDLIGKIKALDMEDVRRQVAAQEAEHPHDHGDGHDHGHDHDHDHDHKHDV